MTHKKPIHIIYEDESLVIVNKRSGMLSVPGSNTKTMDLGRILNQQLQTTKMQQKILPCHRLDKETSGVIIFARSKEIQQMVMDQFRKRKIKKTYIAFVQGCFNGEKGVIKSNIQGAWPYNRNADNKLAITNYTLIHNAGDFSIMRIEPITGRTNQIRIQFKDRGHPLVGERRFAFAKDWPVKFKRAALHSYSIEINHPLTGQRMQFSAPIPEDMLSFLKQYDLADIFR